MRALAVMLGLLGATAAQAEGGWLTARGRVPTGLELGAWGGSRSVGLGVVRPDAPGARASLGLEGAWAWTDRTVEVRGTRAWQLGPRGFATPAVTVGASLHLVPEGLAVGIGPHAGLHLALGGDTVAVHLGLQTGVEAFSNDTHVRLPQRALVGLEVRLGDWAVGLHARAGVDVVPGRYFLGRGEVVLSLGWGGLGARPPAK